MSDSSQGPGRWQASDGQWYPPESAQQPLAPPPPSAGNIAESGVSKQRNWKKIGLIGGGVLVALMAIAALASPSEDENAATLDPDAQAIEDGYVALCNDGNYSDNTDFSATCSGGDGIDKWLASFGECEDGTVIKMSDSATCGDNGGFKGLLPADFEPTPRESDVALCKDGTYADNTDFSATCSSRGGVDRWLAPYGECKDGTVIAMDKESSCTGNSGFKGLLPEDYEPTTTTAAPTTTAPPATTAPPTTQPALVPPTGTVTAANSPEFAAILGGSDCGGEIGRFASRYQGRTIEFDAYVADVANSGGGYDILFLAGDAGSLAGPSFKFESVAMSDLGLTGGGAEVRVNNNVRLVATVDRYNEMQCLFFIRPVSTTLR